ncbi:MAG: YggT family protein [Candidatus Kerfeldbacteria bacterium]|nr:YggT family protein [Candidatus Kerfeldbacteria bacterium]
MENDPRQPSKVEEEVVTQKSTTDGQSTRRTLRSTPDQQAEEVTTRTVTPSGETMQRKHVVGASPVAARDFERKRELFHAYRFIWYILSFIEIFLAFRFFLKATAANPDSGFSQLIYTISGVFVDPFAGIYRQTTVVNEQTVAIVEWSTLVAAGVYVLLAWGVVALFRLYRPTNPDEIEQNVAQT